MLSWQQGSLDGPLRGIGKTPNVTLTIAASGSDKPLGEKNRKPGDHDKNQKRISSNGEDVEDAGEEIRHRIPRRPGHHRVPPKG